MKCLGMKPGGNRSIAARTIAVATGLVLASGQQAVANPLSRVTLDGLTSADGIRHWIEIAEPGNLGLLFMGIAGLLIGRWAAGKKRKGPPDQ